VKVLLDHNLPHSLRSALIKISTHEIFTASYLGWGGLKNGDLIAAAEDKGIEVFATGDSDFLYETQHSGRRIAVIVLSANNWPIIKDNVVAILAAIDNAAPGSVVAVDCGIFSRKRGDL
jgi:predicted nuclease of predicted toxin-antitoxin system